MMKFFSFISCIFLIVSCQKSKPNTNGFIGQNIENSYKDWWVYFNDSIQLSSDFTALDAQSDKINKELFLKSLATGQFIPLKHSVGNSQTAYKLHQLKAGADVNIISTMKNLAEMELINFYMEGKKMKDFSFTALSGKHYTSENTLGKTVVLKCWYIHCQKCVEEMPELNKLVQKYKNREDVIFVSLAFDSDSDLKKFLSKRDFDYAVVPNQKQFMKETLNISQFPTHFIINKKGIIAKVITDAKFLEQAVKAAE